MGVAPQGGHLAHINGKREDERWRSGGGEGEGEVEGVWEDEGKGGEGGGCEDYLCQLPCTFQHLFLKKVAATHIKRVC